MRALTLLVCLAWIPTNLLLSTPSSITHVYGLWYDDYSNTTLEIKRSGKHVKVRSIDYGRKRKWRKYYNMGRGVYDDCAGKAIIVQGRNRIKWRTSRRRAVILSRYDDYGYSTNRNRSYDNDDYYRSGTRSLERDRYCGEWYCDDRGLELRIESYRDGFRAQRPGDEWVYYNPYSDREYRDRKGNRYYFEGGDLVWSSRDNRRRFKFKKR